MRVWKLTKSSPGLLLDSFIRAVSSLVPGIVRRGKLGKFLSRLAGRVVARCLCVVGLDRPSIFSGRNIGCDWPSKSRRGEGRGVLEFESSTVFW